MVVTHDRTKSSAAAEILRASQAPASLNFSPETVFVIDLKTQAHLSASRARSQQRLPAHVLAVCKVCFSSR